METIQPVAPEAEASQEVKHFKPVFEMDPEEKEILKAKVEKSDGLVRIFIHPFYSRVSDNFKDVKRDPAAVEEGMVRIINSSDERTPPLFLFEQQMQIEDSEAILADVLESSHNDLYLVPTQVNSANPKMSKSGEGDSTAARAKAWTELRSLFREVGVKKIIIGGMHMKIEPVPSRFKTGAGYHPKAKHFLMNEAFRRQREKKGARSTDYYITQCVGEAAQQLSSFDLEISGMTFPDSRKELHEIEKGGLPVVELED